MTNLVYVLAAVVSYAVGQYTCGLLQLGSSIASTMFHRSRETKYLPLDAIISGTLGVIAAYVVLDAIENELHHVLGLKLLHFAGCAFTWIYCGMPGGYTTLSCSLLMAVYHPDFDAIVVDWLFPEGMPLILGIFFFSFGCSPSKADTTVSPTSTTTPNMGLPRMESTIDFYRLLMESPVRSPKAAKMRKPFALHPLPGPVPVAYDSPPRSASPRRLPHLETRVLMRECIVLHEDGSVDIGVDEILQYNEVESRSIRNPLALRLPGKCDAHDEVPLMPCHGQLHRSRLLPVELYPEPIRDRDKHWAQDELPTIQVLEAQSLNMTRSSKTTGKWRLRQQNVPLGEGVHGRVYGVGLHSHRRLVLDVYDPSRALTHNLSITMDKLEDLFEDHRAYLTAGRKDDLVQALISMLYFEYPSSGSPVLHIDKRMKTSASKLRRLERDKLRRLAEEEKRLAELRFLSLPRRARYRVLCTSHKISSFLCIVAVYHYPHQARNFFITATHPPSSAEFHLPLGLLYAAKAAAVPTAPHTWTPAIKTAIARKVVENLRLVRNTAGEMALSVVNRVGYYTKGIPLEEPQTPESVARQHYILGVQNAIKELQQSNYTEAHFCYPETALLERELRLLEAERSALDTKDQAIKEQLDEIESRGLGAVDDLDKEQRHAARQLVREQRALVKKERGETLVELKRVQTRLTALLTEIQAMKTATDALLKEKAIALDAGIVELQAVARSPPPFVDIRAGDRRYASGYRKIHKPRALLGDTTVVRMGAALVHARRVRYTVSVLPERFVHFSFYVPESSLTASYVCSLPTWCIWAKEGVATKRARHDMQMAIPNLIRHPNEANSNALLEQMEAVDAAIEAARAELAIATTPAVVTTLLDLHRQRRRITTEAARLYHHVVTAFCERLTISEDGSVGVNNVLVTMDPYTLVVEDGSERTGCCVVRLESEHQVVFDVRTPDGSWANVHPYTQELVLELASESAQEMMVHLELIATNIQLVRTENGHDALAFLD
ncbi:hypothetical protein ACHHYP_12093 [Achlya hypogyna]|uniref:Uncharacterized protein n=1 Tax=Achlya hypogyna TaxID=1202772 RepID=A0A1V9YHM9_ACHHY|nr:hypothetical protein ACHHYP_12093 [Achlya hypogyna]